MEHEKRTEKIIGCAMTVRRTLGPDFLESVYHNALAHEIRKAGLEVECKKALAVTFDGVVVDDFFPDMLVKSTIILENKGVQSLAAAYQCLSSAFGEGRLGCAERFSAATRRASGGPTSFVDEKAAPGGSLRELDGWQRFHSVESCPPTCHGSISG